MIYLIDKLGFGKWRHGWIWECISPASFSVLVNGLPSQLFKSSRGIRQGEPLSPFLFTTVAEALSALLVNGKGCGCSGGFEMGSGEEAITHLQFVVDTILFSSSMWEEVVTLKDSGALRFFWVSKSLYSKAI